ncbi:hypothetical protein [Dysgonomonas sp. 520]|uniref:hypothetical protein n=1 Tax=Dysgonomonas sp. 520 TaxID=2302931 RepID=UPI0013D68E8A|nr:hypothetical protein [Dysgonomonas sp. 520]NDW09862.1 hypothetical protein [Dysgonomonas sp. 520]
MEEKKNNKLKYVLIVAIILLLAGLGVAAYFILQQKTQLEENQEIIEFSRQQIEDEYKNLDAEYEELKIDIRNDSLLHQLENEQTKVQRLMEEIKKLEATKSSDAKEIKRLKDELTTLRSVLRSYVAQIDSLNRINQQLTQEKLEITNKYQETSRALNQVSQEKSNLSEKVTLAAKLDATNISVRATNAKGKDQKNIKKIEQFVVSFLITKNITAEPGERNIYVRIMKPDDSVLTKSASNTFAYENRQVNYSMKRLVEYTGEETSVVMYWKVEEFLMPGTYRVDIFADGNRIGSSRFTLSD